MRRLHGQYRVLEVQSHTVVIKKDGIPVVPIERVTQFTLNWSRTTSSQKVWVTNEGSIHTQRPQKVPIKSTKEGQVEEYVARRILLYGKRSERMPHVGR